MVEFLEKTRKKILVGCLLMSLLFISYYVLRPLMINCIYHNQVPEFLQNIIHNQHNHPLEHYIRYADLIVIKFTLYLIILSLCLILPTNWRLGMIALILTLTTLELGLRGYEEIINLRYQEPQDNESIFFEYSPTLGWKNKSHSKQHFISKSNHIDTVVSINDRGIRDQLYNYQKASNTQRVLLVGDSVMEGFEVADQKVIDAQLERKLNKIGSYEVINMGTRGYGTDQTYLLFQQEGYRYQPDWVIYTFVSNDLFNNITQHEPHKKFQKPFFVIDEHDHLLLKGSPVSKEITNPDQWQMSYPEIANYLNLKSTLHNKKQQQEYKRLSLGRLIRKDLYRSHLILWIKDKIERNQSLTQLFTHLQFLDRPEPLLTENLSPFIVEKQWQITTALIKAFAAQVESKGAQFVVYEFTATGNEQQPTQLQKICEQVGIAYFNSFEQFKKHAHKRNTFRYVYDGHWNAKGHALAADEFYQYITTHTKTSMLISQ